MTESTRTSYPRRAKKDVQYDGSGYWIPNLNSDNPIHREVEALNKETYPSKEFMDIDDSILRMLCGAKSGIQRWSSLKPELSSTSHALRNVSAGVLDDLIKGRDICHDLTHPDASKPTTNLMASVDSCVESLVDLSIFQPASNRRKKIMRHLLYRYALLFQPDSCVTIMKVQFVAGGPTSLGLKAAKDIPAGTYLIETCSSMSSDIVSGDGPSIIESKRTPRGPAGRRVILGPFRCGNHDCEPSAQFEMLEGGEAAVMVTLQNVKKGQEITVKYRATGYYREGPCLCCSCEDRPTNVLKRSLSVVSSSGGVQEGASGEPAEKKKKTRRGGGSRKKQFTAEAKRTGVTGI